jgi:hypothetical protein
MNAPLVRKTALESEPSWDWTDPDIAAILSAQIDPGM